MQLQMQFLSWQNYVTLIKFDEFSIIRCQPSMTANARKQPTSKIDLKLSSLTMKDNVRCEVLRITTCRFLLWQRNSLKAMMSSRCLFVWKCKSFNLVNKPTIGQLDDKKANNVRPGKRKRGLKKTMKNRMDSRTFFEKDRTHLP